MNTPHRHQETGRKKLSGAAALVAETRDGWHNARIRNRAPVGPFGLGVEALSPVRTDEMARVAVETVQRHA